MKRIQVQTEKGPEKKFCDNLFLINHTIQEVINYIKTFVEADGFVRLSIIHRILMYSDNSAIRPRRHSELTFKKKGAKMYLKMDRDLENLIVFRASIIKTRINLRPPEVLFRRTK